MINAFKFIEVFEKDHLLYGRPVNPFKKMIMLPGYPDVTFSNRLYREFEAFAADFVLEVYPNITKVGFYHREHIVVVQGANHNYYALKGSIFNKN